MTETTQQAVLDLIGEKWVITYTVNGEKFMGMCNHNQSLPALIIQIRTSGGKNIAIKDQTVFFVDDSDE